MMLLPPRDPTTNVLVAVPICIACQTNLPEAQRWARALRLLKKCGPGNKAVIFNFNMPSHNYPR